MCVTQIDSGSVYIPIALRNTEVNSDIVINGFVLRYSVYPRSDILGLSCRTLESSNSYKAISELISGTDIGYT